MNSDKDQRELGGFADVDRAGADDYVARLDAMRTLADFRAYKADSYELLRSGPGANIADVGCGTGEDVRQLQTLVQPAGSVTGFDVSAAMVAAAAERHGEQPGVRFAQGEAERLPAADGAFDAVRADRVLLHVSDPSIVLAEMLRITRTGGRIVVCEPDMPGCWVASDHRDVGEIVMRRIAESCRHPYVARDLWTLFADAGAEERSLSIQSVTAFSLKAVQQILDLEGVARSLVQHGGLAQDRAAAWIADLSERDRSGRFAAGLSIMVAAGTKP